VLSTKYYQDDQINEDKMDRTYSTHERNTYNILVLNSEEKTPHGRYT
jgi:hypothetical protein